MIVAYLLSMYVAMNLASSDKANRNCRAARASYSSNSFERINQSQKHE